MASIQRYDVEHQEDWRTDIKFDNSWGVKIIPPFGGTMARFCVTKNNKSVSVYFDANDSLGIVGEPYYEAYPIDGEPQRYLLFQVDDMMRDIAKELE